MKRIIIPFVAAFGLSLGIATGVVMMRAPKASPIVPGSVATGVTKPADSTAAKPDSAVAQVADSSHAADTTRSAASAATGPTAPGGDQARVGPDKAVAGSQSKQQQVAAATTTPSTKPAAKLASAPGTARAAGPPPPRPISDSLIGHMLAQVFAAMQPKDAARVLEQMDDSDVRAILGSLSSKQQAAILGSFPTQRAALIVQTTLRTAAKGGSE